MQLQGIVFIQPQGNYQVLNFLENIFIQRTNFYFYSQEIFSFKEIIFIQGNYIHSRKLYSFKEFSSFKENIFIQGIYILSRKYIHSRTLYSFKFKEICLFKETTFIQQRCIPGHSRNISPTCFPSHFLIILSFIVTIS